MGSPVGNSARLEAWAVLDWKSAGHLLDLNKFKYYPLVSITGLLDPGQVTLAAHTDTSVGDYRPAGP